MIRTRRMRIFYSWS